MKVAIVGSRYWADYQTFKDRVMMVLPIDTRMIISGGAGGVDTMAEMLADELGISFVEYLPEQGQPSPECFHSRDRKMARDCNFMIGFPGPKSPGVHNTLSIARGLGIQPVVLWADE